MKATIFDAIGNNPARSDRAVSDVDQAHHRCNSLWDKLDRTHEP
ncbi:hypothetical protein ACFCV3_07710 [Kribbella sp. NPDC056345]